MNNLNKNFISIIIPVYNAENYLDRCINSILSQTYKNFELILIDDFSTDKSLNICKDFAVRDTRIHLLVNEVNKGVSFTRNKGLNKAKGEFVTFVDSDDWVSKTYLEDFFLFPILNDSIVVQGIFYEFKKNKKKIFFSYPDMCYKVSSNNNGVVENELFHNGCPVAKLYETKIIKSNNILFNESISLNEDHLFVLEYYKYVKNITLLSSMNYHYWFDYFVDSLTKRNHGYTNLNTASQGFLNVLPILIKGYGITNKEYLQKLYTTCGINQMFNALINYKVTKDLVRPFKIRFAKFIELKDFISKYYYPEKKSLKIAKYFVLNFNSSVNKAFFNFLIKWLSFRKKMIRFVKELISFFNKSSLILF